MAWSDLVWTYLPILPPSILIEGVFKYLPSCLSRHKGGGNIVLFTETGTLLYTFLCTLPLFFVIYLGRPSKSIGVDLIHLMTSQYSAKRLWLCFLCLATTYIHFSQPACCKHLQGQHSHSCYPAAQAAINITLWPALHSDASITMKCTPGSETAVSEGMYVFTCNSCQIASLSKHKNKNKKLITYISIRGVWAKIPTVAQFQSSVTSQCYLILRFPN